MKTKYLKNKAKEIRKQIIKISYEGIGSHISSSLSIVDILTVLYFDILKINPRNPKDPKRDKFILSKGHAVPALYSVLAHKGFFPKTFLKSYGKEDTFLGAHPEYGYVSGIELSTGSLGHGLSVGCGMALSAKLNCHNSKTFILLSDGECQEGSVWESAIFAAHQKLDNLIAIIDYNKFQAFGKIKEVSNLEPFSNKWQVFGWETREIDGHDIKTIQKTFRKLPLKKNKPTAIIAHTTTGKGISFIENRLEWHYLNLSKEQYRKAILELNS